MNRKKEKTKTDSIPGPVPQAEGNPSNLCTHNATSCGLLCGGRMKGNKNGHLTLSTINTNTQNTMKRTFLLLMIILPLLAQAQTYDTISGPNGRHHRYHYSAWFDTCGVWNDTQSRYSSGHPEVPGGIYINYYSSTPWCRTNQFGGPVYPPRSNAKAEYVPQVSALKGVAVLTTDKEGHLFDWRTPSNYSVTEATSDTLAPDTCMVFKVVNGDIAVLGSARWDTATPKIYKVPWHEDSLHSGYAYIKVFEVYFKTPFEVSDTFYISGSPYNQEVDTLLVGHYLHPPLTYAQFCGHPLPGDPCRTPEGESGYLRINGYDVIWGGDKPTLAPGMRDKQQWGAFLPILSDEHVALVTRSDNEEMGTVGTWYRSVLRWTTQTITAMPNTGYKFTHWNDGNTENPRRVLMDKDSTFIAYFAPKAQYQVAVSTESPEVGYATGGGTYYEDDIATLEAFPASDQYRFSFWGDGNTTNPRYHVVNGDTSFIAFFREVTAIEEVDGTQGLFTLTPNPTTGKVTVTVAQPAPKCELTLRDAAGHEVMRTPMPAERPSMTLDLSSLPAGAYFVTLTTPTATSTQRLVVK